LKFKTIDLIKKIPLKHTENERANKRKSNKVFHFYCPLDFVEQAIYRSFLLIFLSDCNNGYKLRSN